VWGLTPGLLTALQWLQDHSSISSVFAVSNHWVTPDKTDGREYNYSAFSERQVFIEAYDSVRFDIAPGVVTPAEIDFTQRQRLNDAVFQHADAGALRVLTEDYAVRYLFIDRMHGTVDPSVLSLGHVVFTNAAAIIISVG
jgi:hypothetical protein